MSAVFYADKLTTLSRGQNADDMYLLARAYYCTKEFKRAVHFMNENELVGRSPRFALLAAQCLAEVKEWDECLDTIGGDEASAVENQIITRAPLFESESGVIGASGQGKGDANEISTTALLCLMRGKAYEALENRERAVRWYKAAINADTRCVEALDRLVEKNMVSHEEQRQIVESLGQRAGFAWLKPMYKLKMQRNEETTRAVESVAEELAKSRGLGNNLDVLTACARQHYWKNRFRDAHKVTQRVVDADPYHHAVLPIHVCCLVELGLKTKLFFTAHHLVQAYPSKPVSWFTVACYYYLIQKYETARRFFHKATQTDQYFAPAWIGFGHSFAMQDESDQAMAAYRTAARRFRGSHVPLLCMGMEHLRTNSLEPATDFFNQSLRLCPTDPLIFNEMGVLAYMKKDFVDAAGYFHKAVQLAAGEALEAWEPALFNLAHCYRKRGDYDKAAEYYEKALAVAPKSPSVYTCLGFTRHLQGRLDDAIQLYHKSLSIQPRETVTSDLLRRALDKVMNVELTLSDDEFE